MINILQSRGKMTVVQKYPVCFKSTKFIENSILSNGIDHINAQMSALWFTKKHWSHVSYFQKYRLSNFKIQFTKNIESVTTVVFALYSSNVIAKCC